MENQTSPIWTPELEQELMDIESELGINASEAPPTPIQQQQMMQEQQMQEQQMQEQAPAQEFTPELAEELEMIESQLAEMPQSSMAAQEPEEPAEDVGFLEESGRALAKGIKIGVGGLADLPNMVIEAVTLGKSREWGMGAGQAEEYIGGLMESAGISTKTDDSLTSAMLTEATANMVGAGTFGAIGAASRGMKGMKIFTEVTDNFSKAITASLGLSIPGGVGRKYGGDIGESMGLERETGEAIGSLAGNLAPAAVIGGVNKARKAARSINQTFGVTSEGRKSLGAEILRESASDPSKLDDLEKMDLDIAGMPNTGQMLDDAGLMATSEKLKRAPDLVIQNKAEAKAAMQRSDLLETLEQIRPASSDKQGLIQQTMVKKINAVDDAIKSKVAEFEERAQKALDDIAVQYPDSDIPEDYVQVIAQRYSDNVVTEISKQETKLWNSIGNGKFKVDRLAKLFKNGMKEAGSGILDPDEVLTKGYNKLQKFADDGKAMSFNEVKRFRTQLNERIANLDRAGEFEKSRPLKKVRDNLIDELVPADSNVDLDAYAEARKFTSALYKKIRNTGFGKMIQKEGETFKVTPEKALESLNLKGSDGLRALDEMKAGIRQLHPNKAEADVAVKKLDETVKEFIRINYTMASNKSTFMKTWRKPISRYPDLEAQLNDTTYTVDLAKQVTKTAQRRMARLKKFKKANDYLREDVQKSVLDAMRNKSPLEYTRNLMRRAAQDKTGETTEGVKSAFYEAVYDRITKQNGDTVSIDPQKMKGLLRFYKPALKEVFGEDGIKVLEKVELGARINSRQGHGAALAGEARLQKSQGKMSNLAGNVAVFIGTKLHSMLGIGVNELLFAGMARGFGKNAVSGIFEGETASLHAILEEALLDPRAAKELLRIKPLTPIADIKEPLLTIMKLNLARETEEALEKTVED